MNILFDYQAFELQRFGGVSRSYVELISRLQKEKGVNCKIGVKESDNVHLIECGLASNAKPPYYAHKKWFEGKKWFRGQRSLTRKVMGAMGYYNEGLTINQDYCVNLLKRQQFDIFEPTYFESYFLSYLKGKSFVLTVHDMIPELFSAFIRRDDYDFQIAQKRLLCPLARHIHVPSLRTKEDLVNILHVSPEKITVIPHGRPDFISNDYSVPPLFDFPYLLYVGDRAFYKGFSRFAKECSYIVRKFPDIHIVCTGKAFSASENAEIMELGIAKNVIHHFASGDSLRNLYHYAIAFVYPSEYEGFGLPILEAFTSGCPVMLNAASCFPEVAGDAAVYFDINRDGDLYEKFVIFYSMGAGLRKEMIQKGRAQADKYSWEKSAKMLKEMYDSLV